MIPQEVRKHFYCFLSVSLEVMYESFVSAQALLLSFKFVGFAWGHEWVVWKVQVVIGIGLTQDSSLDSEDDYCSVVETSVTNNSLSELATLTRTITQDKQY